MSFSTSLAPPLAASPDRVAVRQGNPGILGPNSAAFLDVLRAFAANLVLFGHASAIFGVSFDAHAGTAGVAIFFILSGFLILQSSLTRIQQSGSWFMPYLIDRFARIFTAYVPALIFVAIVNATVDLGQWGQDGTSTGPVAFLGNLFLLQDYPLFQAIHHVVSDPLYIRPYNSAEPFWTVSIEFWIYVVFGLGFFGLVARERINLAAGLVLGTIALPVVAWNAAAGGGSGLTLVWLFGAAAAYVWVTAGHRSTHKVQLGLIVGLAAAVCLAGRGLKTGWNFQDLGMAACVVLMFISSISIMEGLRPLPQLVRRACATLASYSYSLYLVHNTVFIVVLHLYGHALGMAALPCAFALAHLMAYALYWLFERHHRHVGRVLKTYLAVPSRPKVPETGLAASPPARASSDRMELPVR